MIGLERPVDLGPGDLDHDLVVEAEMMEQDRGPGIGVEAKLHGREHLCGPALADEQRPGVAGCLDSEALRVDEPGTGLDRVDAEPGPGEITEGEPRNDLELDRGIGP